MNDAAALAAQLVDACRSRGWRVTTAESCTGGLLSGAITAIAGASDVFDRGFVTYSDSAKTELLGVNPKTLRDHGAVSEEVAREMAAAALKASDADLALAVTGIAGPGGSRNKPEGRVCFGIARRGTPVQSVQHDFGAIGREAVRAVSVTTALALGLKMTGG